MNTLIILAHPTFEESLANKTILNNLDTNNYNEIRNIASLYPNYEIDVKAEQEALLNADTIILQFPFYWYSVPAILKKWLDDVFTYQFAYGSEGDKLKGKNFILSFTVGGPRDAYQEGGYNSFEIKDLIKPLEQTAHLSQMSYIEPIYTHSMIYIPNVYNTQESVVNGALEHVKKLTKVLNELTAKLEKVV